jgi:hypothetical protein
MASSFYPTIFRHLLKGDVDLDTAEVKVLLLTDSYTFSASHNDVADLSGEVSGSAPGYERKVVSVSLTEDLASSGTEGCFINFDLDNDATWTSATFTCRHAVMYINASDVDANSKLLYYFDLGANQTVSSGTFSLLNPNPQPKLRRYNGA